MQEPNDKPITHEDHLFDNGPTYFGNMKVDAAAACAQSVTAKYLKLTQAELEALVKVCSSLGEPLSLRQQRHVSLALASVYQDGMIAALREQTDKAVKL